MPQEQHRGRVQITKWNLMFQCKWTLLSKYQHTETPWAMTKAYCFYDFIHAIVCIWKTSLMWSLCKSLSKPHVRKFVSISANAIIEPSKMGSRDMYTTHWWSVEGIAYRLRRHCIYVWVFDYTRREIQSTYPNLPSRSAERLKPGVMP